jgi:hypothetical protein
MPSSTHNPKASSLITDYIKHAPLFAQPICAKLRALIKKAEPTIIEDWKWGPNFYKDGMVCGFGAFKNHVTLAFFKGSLMKDARKLFNYGDSNAHNRSIKFQTLQDIDEKALIAYIKEAVVLNVKGVKISSGIIRLPSDLKKMFDKYRQAYTRFKDLSFTSRKEMVDSVLGAKKSETRERRIIQIVEKLSKE